MRGNAYVHVRKLSGFRSLCHDSAPANGRNRRSVARGGLCKGGVGGAGGCGVAACVERGVRGEHDLRRERRRVIVAVQPGFRRAQATATGEAERKQAPISLGCQVYSQAASWQGRSPAAGGKRGEDILGRVL